MWYNIWRRWRGWCKWLSWLLYTRKTQTNFSVYLTFSINLHFRLGSGSGCAQSFGLYFAYIELNIRGWKFRATLSTERRQQHKEELQLFKENNKEICTTVCNQLLSLHNIIKDTVQRNMGDMGKYLEEVSQFCIFVFGIDSCFFFNTFITFSKLFIQSSYKKWLIMYFYASKRRFLIRLFLP